jgi:hypothetical protein|tara:strand:- start:258 stop:857 length:600 start_codon:yes stop_codon:yes gene_type:complete
MKSTILFFLIIFSLSIFAQSNSEQELYSNNIWIEVENGKGEIAYFNSDDIYLGGKKITPVGTVYFDRRKRTIKEIPSNKEKIKSIQIKKSKKKKFLFSKCFTKHGRYYVRSKRNKTSYYSEKGALIRTVRKKGNTIYYKNSQGKLVGYKKLGENGFVEYRDVRGRKTGTSYLNSAGFLVYRQYKKRKTLAFMISDAYLF